jgi:hypothetical protein
MTRRCKSRCLIRRGDTLRSPVFTVCRDAALRSPVCFMVVQSECLVPPLGARGPDANPGSSHARLPPGPIYT